MVGEDEVSDEDKVSLSCVVDCFLISQTCQLTKLSCGYLQVYFYLFERDIADSLRLIRALFCLNFKKDAKCHVIDRYTVF